MILHNHDHHDHDEPAPNGRLSSIALRYAVAAVIVAGAALAACSVMVNAGQAVVITRFGDLVRVVTAPGLAWKAPTPLESTIPVDLRLRTTSTGQQDVGTKDGLRILLQAYIAWQ